MGFVELFIAVNEGILPTPLFINPMFEFELVQLKLVAFPVIKF